MDVFTAIKKNKYNDFKKIYLSNAPSFNNRFCGLDILLYSINYHKFGFVDYILRNNYAYNNSYDVYGNNPLHYACKIGVTLPIDLCDNDISIIKDLNKKLEEESLINKVKHYLLTPNLKFVSNFVKLVDVNLVNKYGSTALHYACYYWDERLIDILLKSGAVNDIKNKEHKYPSDYIKDIKNIELFNRLYSQNLAKIIDKEISFDKHKSTKKKL